MKLNRFRFYIVCMLQALPLMGGVGGGLLFAQKAPADYVNPFIGTTNFGTCNPGAVCPAGLMSVVPFNVMGSDLNNFDKDARWWSTPYEETNSFFTGYSHVNLSGVGCPDMSSLLLMPTSGQLDVDYHSYGSTYTDEQASPGRYSNRLAKYGIATEVSATPRTSIARFTYKKGQGNVLLNLGEGLTNESGAFVRYVSDTEIEGQKMLGGFCYNSSHAWYPCYFVLRLSKVPKARGFWKMQRDAYGVEKEWNPEAGKYKLYENYKRDLGGDDIGAYWSFDCADGEQVEVQMGVSFVSIENARENLNAEQPRGTHYDDVYRKARAAWDDALSTVTVEGGTEDQKTIFYTALYHLQIHPNILQDVNGQYPAMEGEEILHTDHNRYTVYSLWDTYRCTHQLNTLLFPSRQIDMVNTMLDMYRESGWLPKWELFGRETFTMEGDPAIPVIYDTWSKGLRGFDVNLAYEAMKKGADTEGKLNPLRPDVDFYREHGYCPIEEEFDNSVSHALEYYIADYALSRFAGEAIGDKEGQKRYFDRSMGYKNYYSPEYGTLRPKKADGTFLSPFNPKQGENFEPSPGFHEGNAWNYTFFVPHDVKGLARLMGGDKKFVQNLQKVFDEGNYDPANEPDIAYPYLFSYFKGEEWRTQKLTREWLGKVFLNAPAGIPGNDDTGTMSAWAVFTMMGIYPDNPADPSYTITAPVFDKVTIRLEQPVNGHKELVISAPGASKSDRIQSISVGGKKYGSYRISHTDLLKNGGFTLKMK